MTSGDNAPRLARPFVAVLIAAMLASALFVWEPWPLTSFRLFSHLRYDEQASWQATAVTRRGEEVELPLGGSPQGLRGFGFVMAEFAEADVDRQDLLCRTWLDAAPGLTGRRVFEVRLEQRRWRLSQRSGKRALPGELRHFYTCTGEGVEVVG